MTSYIHPGALYLLLVLKSTKLFLQGTRVEFGGGRGLKVFDCSQETTS